MTADSPIQTEDLISVRSRISWGAIIAGSVLALALYFLLTLLGGAIGFSISDRFGGRTIGIAAAIYAIVVTAGCLFAGGLWPASSPLGKTSGKEPCTACSCGRRFSRCSCG